VLEGRILQELRSVAAELFISERNTSAFIRSIYEDHWKVFPIWKRQSTLSAGNNPVIKIGILSIGSLIFHNFRFMVPGGATLKPITMSVGTARRM
jgi:hypothetical protein